MKIGKQKDIRTKSLKNLIFNRLREEESTQANKKEFPRTRRKTKGFPGGSVIICLQSRKPKFNPWVGKILQRREWQPIPVFSPRETSWTEEPGGLQSTRSESDMTEQLRTQGGRLSEGGVLEISEGSLPKVRK